MGDMADMVNDDSEPGDVPPGPDPFLGSYWFKMAGAGVFHRERADWVASGKASCGADLKAPALEVRSPMPGMQRLCRRCVARFLAAR